MLMVMMLASVVDDDRRILMMIVNGDRRRKLSSPPPVFLAAIARRFVTRLRIVQLGFWVLTAHATSSMGRPGVYNPRRMGNTVDFKVR